MELGARLKKARLISGMSQKELSEKLYLPRSTISKIENGKTSIKGDDLLRWFQVTQAHEMILALIYGTDLPSVVQSLTTLIGGFILWI
ncbi:helix-turn-helix domain-containing protein [Lederbergia galactosidilytica]|uniref:HTH cro/C1-type domain-containing protein n=1 Tax=Lederbergia galactosidilytica TaxID=217031 RepID=A0A177ZQN5_9BACI|nr:helix-turn-helix transcriptional regulator [Lederbergia galactosidilytica]OAK70054.1 hypothetical protein ABB05_12780 [Lederbergia galactosidilytica]